MPSPAFALVKTLVFDVEIDDADAFALRLELFQDETDAGRFRASLWREETFRIQSTFPQSASTGEPEDSPSDELILVDWSHQLSRNYSDFGADNADAAVKTVLDDFQRWLRHTIG